MILRVVFEPEGVAWVAQARESDYAAQGYSFDDTQRRFTNGLKATLEARAAEGHPLFDEPCPEDVWADMAQHTDARFYTLNTDTWTWTVSANV